MLASCSLLHITAFIKSSIYECNSMNINSTRTVRVEYNSRDNTTHGYFVILVTQYSVRCSLFKLGNWVYDAVEIFDRALY